MGYIYFLNQISVKNLPAQPPQLLASLNIIRISASADEGPRSRDPPLGPPSTLAEIFRNPRTTFEIFKIFF